MGSEVLISYRPHETRVARMDNGTLSELLVERHHDKNIVGNIYLGRITRVLPGMQACFVEIGLQRTAFLYVSNIVDPNNTPNVALEDVDESSADPDKDSEEEASNSSFVPDKNISELVSEGQKILVQATKEPLGTKGARLTGYVSLPGRYLVYLPDSKHLGVSRRIENAEERDRLKSILEKNKPGQGGLIARTVAEGASEKQLKDDLEYLIKLWGTVKKSASKQNDPGLLYTDLDLSLRVIRDRVTEDVDRIVVDQSEAHKSITKFVSNYLPRFKKRIELYSGKVPLFEHLGIESDINRAIGRKVWLKSGGYIVIDETEALTSIDVNTGRFVGRRNLEETILQTNLEAVKEIAYQIRLRNLGGMIILDFIDMTKSQHKDRIYQNLLEELRKDPVRTNVLPISGLGLIEMTRKRTQESLRKQLTQSCEYCEGSGYLKSRETIAFQILRDCEKEIQLGESSAMSLAVYCHPTIAKFFADDERSTIEEFERRWNRRLSIKIDPNFHIEDFEIFAREA